eukprot:scaffold155779_cov46-Prasinocladus_malaysianus.AAC.2
MRFALAFAVAALLATVASSFRTLSQDKTVKDGSSNGSTRVLAKLTKSASVSVASAGASALSLASISSATDATVLTKLGVVVIDSYNADATTASILSNPDFEYAEPDFEVHISDTIPNDPSYGSLWGMPRIGAPSAWDVTTGDSSVVVCSVLLSIVGGRPKYNSSFAPKLPRT